MSNICFFPVWAGPAVRFLRYAPAFRKAGITTTFITAKRPRLLPFEIIEDSPVIRLSSERCTYLKFTAVAIIAAIRARPRPRVVLFLLAAPIHSLLIRSLRFFRIRTIFVSTMAIDIPNHRSLRLKFSRRWQSFFYRSFDRVVCSTEFLAEGLRSLGVNPQKLSIIANGVSLTRFRPVHNEEEKRQLRQKWKLAPDGLIFLFVGLVDDRKGVLDLLVAWREYGARGGRGQLVVVGQQQRDRSELQAFFDKWDQELKITAHVDVRDACPQVEELFRAADGFFFLSKKEGLPNVLPEAMASGLPILSTRFLGLSDDFGRDQEELLLVDRDPQKIATELQRLEQNPELRDQLSRQGRRWVENHHDVEKSLKAYQELFMREAHA